MSVLESRAADSWQTAPKTDGQTWRWRVWLTTQHISRKHPTTTSNTSTTVNQSITQPRCPSVAMQSEVLTRLHQHAHSLIYHQRAPIQKNTSQANENVFEVTAIDKYILLANSSIALSAKVAKKGGTTCAGNGDANFILVCARLVQ